MKKDLGYETIGLKISNVKILTKQTFLPFSDHKSLCSRVTNMVLVCKGYDLFEFKHENEVKHVITMNTARSSISKFIFVYQDLHSKTRLDRTPLPFKTFRIQLNNQSYPDVELKGDAMNSRGKENNANYFNESMKCWGYSENKPIGVITRKNYASKENGTFFITINCDKVEDDKVFSGSNNNHGSDINRYVSFKNTTNNIVERCFVEFDYVLNLNNSLKIGIMK